MIEKVREYTIFTQKTYAESGLPDVEKILDMLSQLWLLSSLRGSLSVGGTTSPQLRGLLAFVPPPLGTPAVPPWARGGREGSSKEESTAPTAIKSWGKKGQRVRSGNLKSRLTLNTILNKLCFISFPHCVFKIQGWAKEWSLGLESVSLV